MSFPQYEADSKASFLENSPLSQEIPIRQHLVDYGISVYEANIDGAREM
jgi:hypothetical protein